MFFWGKRSDYIKVSNRLLHPSKVRGECGNLPMELLLCWTGDMILHCVHCVVYICPEQVFSGKPNEELNIKDGSVSLEWSLTQMD